MVDDFDFKKEALGQTVPPPALPLMFQVVKHRQVHNDNADVLKFALASFVSALGAPASFFMPPDIVDPTSKDRFQYHRVALMHHGGR